MVFRAFALAPSGSPLPLQAAGQPGQRSAVPEPAASGAGTSGAAAGSQAAGASPASVPEAQLEGWFRAHVAELWRFVARLGVPPHCIDDVVQEAFIAAHRRRADIAGGQARGFLFAAAVRLASNQRQKAHVRRERSEGELIEEAPSGAPDAEQLLMDKRMTELLLRALSGLSEPHRVIFVLYELEGFSAPEIAGLLELPLGTVASRLGRARSKFSEVAAQLQATHQEAT